MSSKWATAVIITVISFSVWAGWSIYKALVAERDETQYMKLIEPIDKNFHEDTLKKTSERFKKVFILQENIVQKDSEQTKE